MTRKLSRYLHVLIFSFLFFPPCEGLSQVTTPDADSLNYIKTDSVITAILATDSASFLSFLDSLLNMKTDLSVISARTGYISNITNAGRNFGLNQFGFSAGASYYHSTGLYADINLYWNSDAIPKINPLIISLGYIGNIGKKFSISGSFEHYFYLKNNDTVQFYYPLTNSITVSPYFDTKWFSAGADYSFLFGAKTAHRIRPNIYGNIVFKDKGFIDQIRIMPGASMLIGNQDIVSQNAVNINVQDYINQVGGRKNFQMLYKKYGNSLYKQIYNQQVSNEFGIMNYALSLPVSFMVNEFTLALSYFYNIPVALPGENIDLQPNSYFSISLIYSLPIIRVRKAK